jgi:hypothetical protein
MLTLSVLDMLMPAFAIYSGAAITACLAVGVGLIFALGSVVTRFESASFVLLYA